MLANHASASNDSPQGDSEYEIILTALMETARGRSFLQEFAQRNRATDTATLLTAIGRIEGLLTSRSLEPAALQPADDVPPATATASTGMPDIEGPDAEASDVETMAAGIIEIDSDLTPEILEVEAFSIEVVEFDTVPVEVADSVAAPVDVAALQATAIEFLGPDCLGPDPTDAKPARIEPAPIAKRAPRDPFADIRALSDDEKIALFT